MIEYDDGSGDEVAGALVEGGEGDENDGEEEEAEVENAEGVAAEKGGLVGGLALEGDDAEAEHDFSEGSAGVGFDEGGVEDVEETGGPIGEEEEELARLGNAARKVGVAGEEEDHGEEDGGGIDQAGRESAAHWGEGDGFEVGFDALGGGLLAEPAEQDEHQ